MAQHFQASGNENRKPMQEFLFQLQEEIQPGKDTGYCQGMMITNGIITFP